MASDPAPKATMLAPPTYSMNMSSTSSANNNSSPMHSPKSMPTLLNPSDTTRSPQSHSYPSPSTGPMADGAVPFFTNPTQRTSSIDNFHLPALAQHAQLPIISPSNSAALTAGAAAALLRQSSSPIDPTVPDPNAEPDSTAGTTAPRKRSKASRACDECRRKKIRCDATAETLNETCANCKRLGAQCQFSRPPMKRGPSKGYIQNLADRVNELENSRQSNGLTLSTNFEGEPEFSQPVSAPGSISKPNRKRTFSVSNDSPSHPFFPPTQRASVGGWPPSDSSRHLPYPPSAAKMHTPHSSVSDRSHRSSQQQSSFSSNGNASHSTWNANAFDHRGSGFSTSYDTNSSRPNTGELPPEWDEKMIDEYYGVIHKIFPLLPHSRPRLQSLVSSCPQSLQEAFLSALYATLRSALGPLFPPSETSLSDKANYRLNAFQSDNTVTRSTSVNLVHLQTVVLMCMDAGCRGPVNSKTYAGQPQAVWLGTAFGLASHTRLHIRGTTYDDDVDSDENVARRTFLTLVNLDRWHAASTSSPLLSSQREVAVVPEDRLILGDAVYEFTRLSSDLATLSVIIHAPDPPTTLLETLETAILLRLHESIADAAQQFPFLNLAFHHLQLIVSRYAKTCEPYSLLDSALSLLTLLKDDNVPQTPLHHHFIALLGLTLIEVSEQGDAPGAEQARAKKEEVRDLLDRRLAGNEVEGWDKVVRDALSNSMDGKESQASLQHLADLAIRTGSSASATGGSSSTPEQPTSAPSAGATGTASSTGASASGNGAAAARSDAQRPWDPTRITRIGYLSVFGVDE